VELQDGRINLQQVKANSMTWAQTTMQQTGTADCFFKLL
jgi:hypothetical protein